MTSLSAKAAAQIGKRLILVSNLQRGKGTGINLQWANGFWQGAISPVSVSVIPAVQ